MTASGSRQCGIAVLVVLAICALCSPTRALSQDAQDYFHSGAKEFIGDKLEDASRSVEDGLALEPDDSGLLSLKALIDQAREEKEKQEQEQQQNDQQSEGDQEEQDEQGEQDQQEESGDESEEQEQQQQEQQDDQQGEQQSEDQQDGGEQETDSQNEGEGQSEPQPAEPDPNQLSREEAERILQALENEEGKLLRQVQKMKVRPRRVEKDW